jgi:hypothetical protein
MTFISIKAILILDYLFAEKESHHKRRRKNEKPKKVKKFHSG